MTIEEVRDYAKERGIPEKRIAELEAELHPDENGKLSLVESLQACNAINYIADLRASTKAMLEAGKAIKNKRRRSNANH